jgi:hypothetical protein
MSLPKSMKALCYSEPRKYSVVEVPLPVVRDGDVLIKGWLARKAFLMSSRCVWCLWNGFAYS